MESWRQQVDGFYKYEGFALKRKCADVKEPFKSNMIVTRGDC